MKRTADSDDDGNKRSKIELNLRLNDENFSENDYQLAFKDLGYKLMNFYELVVNDEICFRLCEIEFYFYQANRHPDTFTHRHPNQMQPYQWYFHRQSLSIASNYRAGTYKGLDITLSSMKDESYGGILIRSIQNKQTGKIHEGSCIVVDTILKLSSNQTIKQLVEEKLNNNLDIFHRNSSIYLRSISSDSPCEIVSSPRVGLTLKVPTIDRERFLFRSYRFTWNDYYPSKMKMTILLCQAAQFYFQNSDNAFVSYADQLSTKMKTRFALVKTYLHDLQVGFDCDTTKKSSPLFDFYKKSMSTSDLAKAYGIWLKNYRTKL